MIYPVYIHKGDDEHAHGAEIPDLPGCFAAADEWHDLPVKILEAIDVSLSGEGEELPPSTALSTLVACHDFHGGVWMLFDTVSGELKQPTSDQ